MQYRLTLKNKTMVWLTKKEAVHAFEIGYRQQANYTVKYNKRGNLVSAVNSPLKEDEVYAPTKFSYESWLRHMDRKTG